MRCLRGFSLIEMLVALAVFSILGIAVTGLFVQGLQVRRQNQLNIQAQTYANLVLEQYKSTWSNPDNYDAHKDAPLPTTPGAFDLARIDIDRFCVYLDGTFKAEADCDSEDIVPPPLRRVQVTLTDTEGKVRADMTAEIGNPRP